MGSVRPPYDEARAGLMSSNNEGRSAAPSARSGGLDDVDGGPDGAGYIHIGGIEQVRVRRLPQGCSGAAGIAFVAFADIGQDRSLVDRAARRLVFGGAAARTHLRRCGDENLNVGIRTNDGADIAAIEHGAGRPRRKIALESEQRRAHLGNGGNDGRRLTDGMTFEHRLVEVRRVERTRRSNCRRPVAGRFAGIEHGLGNGAIEQPSVEMAQAVMRGQLLAERALAGGGGSVNGDDHVRSAPSERIRSVKPGKLVPMKALSSIRTGCSLASPMTSAAMAMR